MVGHIIAARAAVIMHPVKKVLAIKTTQYPRASKNSEDVQILRQQITATQPNRPYSSGAAEDSIGTTTWTR